METFFNFVGKIDYGDKIIWSLVWLFTLILLNKLINRILYKAIKTQGKYYTIKKRMNYLTSFIFFLLMLFIWSDSTSNLTTYIGLLSAGIAIALKEFFVNIAAWLFIAFKKPFDVGHRVLIGDQRGDVIDIRVFQFSLMEVSSYEDGEQSTGRIIDVPNYYVLTYPVINYTKGFEYIWNEIKVVVTFESDWKLAKTLLTDIVNKDAAHLTDNVKTQLNEAAKKYMIQYNKLTPIVYTDVLDSGVQLTLRYLCSPKQRRTSNNAIWEDILIMLDEQDNIDLAYPTRRVVNG